MHKDIMDAFTIELCHQALEIALYPSMIPTKAAIPIINLNCAEHYSNHDGHALLMITDWKPIICLNTKPLG